MSKQYTFAMVKSGAVLRRQSMAILSTLPLIGAEIKLIQARRLSEPDVAALYIEHVGKHFYHELRDSVMGQHGVLCLILSGEGVIARWRRLIGATDPTKASPGTLRYDYGVGGADNAVHGSATVIDAGREIKLMFPEVSDYLLNRWWTGVTQPNG